VFALYLVLVIYSDHDISPPRRGRGVSSPSRDSTRSSTQQRHVTPPRKLDTKSDDTNMADGKLTGLQSAQALREESERRKKAEKEALKTVCLFIPQIEFNHL
jgi:hypothetical protein